MIFDVVNFGVEHSLENLAHDFISFKLFSSAYCAISPPPPPLSRELGGGGHENLGGGDFSIDSEVYPVFCGFIFSKYPFCEPELTFKPRSDDKVFVTRFLSTPVNESCKNR